MAPQSSIRLTYEDYAAIPDDGRRHEVIDERITSILRRARITRSSS